MYGMDADIQEEDIAKSVNIVLGRASNDEEVEVKTLRPMNGGRQAAAILALPTTINKLLGIKNFQAGIFYRDHEGKGQ